MKAIAWAVSLLLSVFLAGCAGTSPTDAPPAQAQITVLYDAFGKVPGMDKDWGYAALVEYGGQRILFDTGNNPDALARNAKAKGIDLSRLDFVVMSHRHGDHMGGMAYLLSVNTFTALKKAFGDHYLYAGLGTTLAIGDAPRALAGGGDPPVAMDADDLASYRTLLAASDDDEHVLAER